MFPLGTDRPLRRPTLTTLVLIGACVVMFLVERGVAMFGGGAGERASELMAALWLDPRALTVWGFVTYEFLHGGLLHLLGNMLFLWVFGPNVEDRLGRFWFLVFFLVGGAAAGGAHVLFDRAPVVGASGSIAAVTGAYLVLFPRTHIRTVWMIGIIGVFNIPAMWFIGFAVAKDLFWQGMGGSGVAHLAHLGGYAFGFVVAFALLATGALEREPYDLFTIQKQAKRRRQFRELTSRGANPWEGVPPAAAPAAKRRQPAPANDAAAERRAEVSRLASAGDLPAAAAAYLALLDDSGDVALPRRTQYDLANHLFASGEHRAAARAYRIFLDVYEKDPEAARMRLMLGLINARYLGEPEPARALLTQAERELRDEGDRALARAVLGEIGGAEREGAA